MIEWLWSQKIYLKLKTKSVSQTYKYNLGYNMKHIIYKNSVHHIYIYISHIYIYNIIASPFTIFPFIRKKKTPKRKKQRRRKNLPTNVMIRTKT